MACWSDRDSAPAPLHVPGADVAGCSGPDPFQCRVPRSSDPCADLPKTQSTPVRDCLCNEFTDKMRWHVGAIGIALRRRYTFLGRTLQDAQGLIHSSVEFHVLRIRAQTFLKHSQRLFGIVSAWSRARPKLACRVGICGFNYAGISQSPNAAAAIPLNHSREQRDAIAKSVAYGFRLTASSGTPDIRSAT